MAKYIDYTFSPQEGWQIAIHDIMLVKKTQSPSYRPPDFLLMGWVYIKFLY